MNPPPVLPGVKVGAGANWLLWSCTAKVVYCGEGAIVVGFGWLIMCCWDAPS